MANKEDFEIQYDVLIKYNGTDKEVVIPDGVTAIGEKAFYENKTLESVKFPESVTEIGKKAFSLCEKLVEVQLPKSLEKIGERAFEDCSSLMAVNIPDGVVSILHHAFFNCNFKMVTLPDSLKELGYLAFGGMNPLEIINVSSVNKNFTSDDGVLYNKDKTTLLMYPQNKTEKEFCTPDSVTKIEAFAFALMGNELHTVVRINEGVTEIGHMAFSGALNAGDVYLPASITKIGDDAFNGFGLASKASIYCVKGSDAENLLRYNNHDIEKLLIDSLKSQED